MDLGSVNTTSKNVMTAIASLFTRPKAVPIFNTDYGNEFSTMDNLDCSWEECCYNVPTSDDEEAPRPYQSLDETIPQAKFYDLKFYWTKV